MEATQYSEARVAEHLTWRNPRLNGRIPELDGLRGAAILLVVVYHYAVCLVQVSSGSAPAYLVSSLSLTWSGVDLFFVLSGFLIGGILFDMRHAQNYYPVFYGRRFYRILPLYCAWLGVFLIGLYFAYMRTDWLYASFNSELPVWSYPLFLQNFFMASGHNFGSQWVGPTWSLALEEQFYLLLPFVIRQFSPRLLLPLTCVAVACAPLFRVAIYLSGNTTYGPGLLLPCRADALGFGVLAALLLRNQSAWNYIASHKKGLGSIFLMLGAGVVLLTRWHSPWVLATIGYTWLAAFYASLLLLVVVNPGPLMRVVFGNSLLIGLGTISYGVYLLHQGMLGLAHGAFFQQSPIIRNWSDARITVLSLVAVVALASASWRWFEGPLVRWAQRRFRYLRPQISTAL